MQTIEKMIDLPSSSVSAWTLEYRSAKIARRAWPPSVRTVRSRDPATAGVGSAQVRKLRESTKRRKLVRRLNACMTVEVDLDERV
jgi:hypothetical protein